MASSSCQNRLGKAEKERKQNLLFRSVPTQPGIENSKKNQKIKKNQSASFQAKTGRERPRKRENKNYRSDQFVPYP